MTEVNKQMTPEQFNERVAEELEDRGRDAVAQMSRDYDGDMSSMSASALAAEEGLDRTAEAVDEVADARVEWFDGFLASGSDDDAVELMHALAASDADVANISGHDRDEVIARVVSDDVEEAEEIAESHDFSPVEVGDAVSDGRQTVTFRSQKQTDEGNGGDA